MADNRSFLACSAGPNTSDRSFDLFDLFRLDRRPLPILPINVILDTPSSLVSFFLRYFCSAAARGKEWSSHAAHFKRRNTFLHVQLADIERRIKIVMSKELCGNFRRTVTFTLTTCNNTSASESQYDLMITYEFTPSLQITILATAARTYAFSGQEVLGDCLENTLNLLKWIPRGPSTPILCLPR